ncbi:hypothetical protein MTR67_004444 [Solanum verrucosum]|uniref:Uncharacterized protein n=1 Tax=Solanum verrucosum TaxID=315347 RepID=A0AAF0Q016_SOLVR|nr:hypothetical protein MTR67_004444 [Solanum verrucosum]
MGMVARVEKMMMQSSVKPVIEELDRTNMDQGSYYDSISPPHRHMMSLFYNQSCSGIWISIADNESFWRE